MMQIFFDRVFGRLLWRKAYHFVGGAVLLSALIVLERAWFLLFLLTYLVVFRFFGKRISFAALGMLMLYVLSDSRLTTLAAGLVLFVGDGMAAIVGTLYGKRKWRWNPTKSLAGSGAFFISAFAAVLLMLEMVMPASTAVFLLAFGTSLSGCLAEMLPFTLIRDRKPDDNLLVVLVSGLVFYGLYILLGLNSLSAG